MSETRTVKYRKDGLPFESTVVSTEPFGEGNLGLEVLVTEAGDAVQPDQVLFDSGCPTCVSYQQTGGPSHVGSRSCRSHGLGAPGGYRAHCTCDTCW